jgi:FMN phosphatase YigB (HAD superfamily)
MLEKNRLIERERTAIVIVDIDGVLANNDHAIHLMNAGDWEAFHAEIPNFPVYEGWARIVDRMYNGGAFIWAMTARQERYRKATEKWLKDHNIWHHELVMRAEHEEYVGWKSREVRQIIAEGYEVELMIDDSQEILESVKDLGFPTVYVHSGLWQRGFSLDN